MKKQENNNIISQKHVITFQSLKFLENEEKAYSQKDTLLISISYLDGVQTGKLQEAKENTLK
ncbi:hypothetical protein, partial [Xanthovirga aplysinae]|uniref:hypothetical protein n=1 Tax=Xanthovirga aplysinae TaxID=2529853 RepID=UPI0012BD1A14